MRKPRMPQYVTTASVGGVWGRDIGAQVKGTDLRGIPSCIGSFANASHVNSLVREIRLLSVGHVHAWLQVTEVRSSLSDIRISFRPVSFHAHPISLPIPCAVVPFLARPWLPLPQRSPRLLYSHLSLLACVPGLPWPTNPRAFPNRQVPSPARRSLRLLRNPIHQSHYPISRHDVPYRPHHPLGHSQDLRQAKPAHTLQLPL